MTTNNTTRRDFLACMSVLGFSGLGSAELFAQEQMPTRQIPGTNESLPIIGLGSSKPVSQQWWQRRRYLAKKSGQ